MDSRSDVSDLTKKEKEKVIRVLKKAKALLDTPFKLVQDWGNFYEYKNGRESGCNSMLNKRQAKNVCRMCAIGAIFVASYHYQNDNRASIARTVLDRMGRKFNFGATHSLKEVHALYDKAIKYVENS